MSDKHLVCKGATVYCNKSMVNKSPGTAIPLTIISNTLVELNGGKTAATDKDCTPANMCFGNCNTGSNPPPPCVANVQWSKFYEGAEVTEAGLKLLTEESEATCTTFGGKVKIAFHGQTANPQPEELAETLPEVMAAILPVNPKEDFEATIENEEEALNIIDAYWIDDAGNEKRELYCDSPVLLYVKVNKPLTGKIVGIRFEDTDNEGCSSQSHSGIVNEEGIVEIRNFKLNRTK